MDILGEGAGWSSFTVRERGKKGTLVRDPRNLTLKHVSYHARIQEFLTGGGESRLRRFLVLSLFYRGGGGNGFIAEKTILSQGSRGGPTFSERGEERIILLVLARITILAFRWHSS